MRVGELEADSTLANALSMAQLFELGEKQGVAQVRRVARVVDGWRQHFASCGVTRRDVDLLAEQIDRPFLADQRAELT
jgi:serine/threonine-protein kinase HipA